MKNQKAFTLIELLIVIAIISIIAGIVFVALDPLTRFKDARDSRRWADASAIMTAIKVSQIDNGGSYISALTNSTTAGVVYMIGTSTTACNATNCNTLVTSSTACVDLSQLVTGGYLGTVPVSPNAANSTWSNGLSGYTVQRASTTGIITVTACDHERAASISVTR